MSIAPGTRLGPYEIESWIGAGGMGQVWRARDARVDRPVALKLLPEDVLGDRDQRARFEREARMLAKLNHPGIATLYSFEELSGRYLLVMELVEGDDLEKRIAAGPLAVGEIFSLASQIAEALAAAHEKGVVHRDLKPANIKVSASGRVKLLDFGLARKWQEEPAGPLDETSKHMLTQSGLVVGTMPYMSPEQVSGRPVDHRTDIFSFGVVLFEMAVGKRPFDGLSTIELATSILRDSPPPVNELRRDVPVGLADLIRLCLHKEPWGRPATAREIAGAIEALRHPSSERPAAAAADVVSVAVLPFSDMSPAKDQAYLCEGMAEEIMNALGKVAGIRVSSRMSTFHASRQSDNPLAIARALNVTQILEGSIRTAPERMRVTAHLTDASNGFQLWSARYDRKADDIFAVQDEIAAGVVEAVTQRLTPGPAAAIRQRSQVRNLEAYHLYLKGKHLRYLNNDLAGALRAFEQAVDLDPLHGPSWVLLAEVNVVCASYGMKESAAALAAAKTALTTAATLQGETGAGWYVACGIALIEKRWDDAHKAILRSASMEPNFVTALCWLGIILAMWGKIEEALPYLQRARQIEPLAPYPYSLTALTLLQARRVEEADRYVEKALGFDATNSLTLWLAGAIQVALRRFDLAVALLEQASNLASGNLFIHDMLGWAFAAGGRAEEARHILEERHAQPGPSGGTLGEVWLLAALGELDEAFALLDRVADQTNVFVLMTGLPGFDPMRSDPRFAAFLKRMTPVVSEGG